MLDVLEAHHASVPWEPDLLRDFESAAAAVDRGEANLVEGLRRASSYGLDRVSGSGESDAALLQTVHVLGSIARSDLASAFSLWCHRVVVEYVTTLEPDAPLRRSLLPGLLRADTLGSTALAAATRYRLEGVPLPVRYREEGGDLILTGDVRWASNLQGEFVVVTAAAHADDPDRTVVVAVPGDTPGLEVGKPPDLLALQATGSASIRFERARVSRDHIVTDSLEPFLDRVLPVFLLLQGALCWGLAWRSLTEARGRLRDRPDHALAPDYDGVRARFDGAAERLKALTVPGSLASARFRDVLIHRLRWAEIAWDAAVLEMKVTGGAGYRRASGAARRLREAAFLPIQAPTEAQLRWAISHSA